MRLSSVVVTCLIIGVLIPRLHGGLVKRSGQHGHHGHGHSGSTWAVHGHNDVHGQLNQTASPLTNATKASFLPHVLRISAFNIKTFGRAKMSDPVVAGIIRDIVSRYDVILIQEIRDATGEALQQLWDMVGRNTYGLSYSERLGRSSYKEQYAYFYRNDRVTLVASHQYDDGVDDYTDEFEREPFSVRLRPIGGSWDLALVGIHVKPGDAVKEIGLLLNAYDDVRKTWADVQPTDHMTQKCHDLLQMTVTENNKWQKQHYIDILDKSSFCEPPEWKRNVIILGDLNADCSYASQTSLAPLPIYNQDHLFNWPLGFETDTTTSTNTDCAYDRFILSGPELETVFIPGSADIYQFELTHQLSYEEMRDVSDHYPIELELY